MPRRAKWKTPPLFYKDRPVFVTFSHGVQLVLLAFTKVPLSETIFSFVDFITQIQCKF
jgi:hypothetical protein